MYHETMLEVAKIENGFLIELRGTWKMPEKEGDGDYPVPECRSGQKEIYAKDGVELGRLIAALTPLLEEEHESEEAFETAFKKAASTE